MLEFSNVTLHHKKKKILDNFTLKLSEGTILGLVGSDSFAKSAILEAASGSIKPSKGKILLDGENIFSRSSSQAYMKTGYMPKHNEFYEHLTVKEFYEIFLALYRVNGRYRERRVDEVLNFLEMEDYRNLMIQEIPSEMKNFLCLGKTILHEPSWIFLDEPFDKLTGPLRKKMSDCLGMLWEQGKSLVINSQMFPELSSFVTEIAVIEGGQLTARGTMESVYEDALKESPVRLRILEGMDQALKILRENDLVKRVIVDGENVNLLFSGGDREEAELLKQLIEAGALVHHFIRDPLDIEQFIWR